MAGESELSYQLKLMHLIVILFFIRTNKFIKPKLHEYVNFFPTN